MPTRHVYVSTGVQGVGSKAVKQDNPTFVNVTSGLGPNKEKPGALLLNPAFVEAEKAGRDTEGIPRTLLAMAKARWEKDKPFLKEAAFSELGVPLTFDEKTGTYVPANERQIEAGRRTFSNKRLRDEFYRRGAKTEGAQKILNEARRRARFELESLGLPAGSKDEKAVFKQRVEDLTPLFVMDIIVNKPEGAPRTPEEYELARLISEGVKSGEIVIPKGIATEADALSAKKKLARSKVVERTTPEIERKLYAQASGIVTKRHRELAERAAKKSRGEYGVAYAEALETLERRKEAEIEKEFLSLMRGYQGTKQSLRIVKKEKLDGLGLLDFKSDLGGSITVVAIGGLIAYALFKAVTAKRT
jgi:hypothetical protein